MQINKIRKCDLVRQLMSASLLLFLVVVIVLFLCANFKTCIDYEQVLRSMNMHIWPACSQLHRGPNSEHIRIYRGSNHFSLSVCLSLCVCRPITDFLNTLILVAVCMLSLLLLLLLWFFFSPLHSK